MNRLALLALTLVLGSCVNFTNSYAPAEARHADVGPDPRGLLAYVDMKDAKALRHLAGGVIPDAFDGEKRRAEARAELRFAVPDAGNWKLVLDVDSATAQPLIVTINGTPVPVSGFDAPGRKRLEAPVPAGLLAPATVTTVAITSTTGIGLYAAGFVRP